MQVDSINLERALSRLRLAKGKLVEFPLMSRHVKALAQQIEISRNAETSAAKRMREWNTLDACQKYDFDPVIESVTERI